MANVITTLTAPSFTVLPSAARTASPDTQEFDISPTLSGGSSVNADTGRMTNWTYPQPLPRGGLWVVVDITNMGATGSLTVAIHGVDRLSGVTRSILSSAAILAAGTTHLFVHPQLTAANNAVAKDVVPPVFRIVATHANAASITYSIGGHLTG